MADIPDNIGPDGLTIEDRFAIRNPPDQTLISPAAHIMDMLQTWSLTLDHAIDKLDRESDTAVYTTISNVHNVVTDYLNKLDKGVANESITNDEANDIRRFTSTLYEHAMSRLKWSPIDESTKILIARRQLSLCERLENSYEDGLDMTVLKDEVHARAVAAEIEETNVNLGRISYLSRAKDNLLSPRPAKERISDTLLLIHRQLKEIIDYAIEISQARPYAIDKRFQADWNSRHNTLAEYSDLMVRCSEQEDVREESGFWSIRIADIYGDISDYISQQSTFTLKSLCADSVGFHMLREATTTGRIMSRNIESWYAPDEEVDTTPYKFMGMLDNDRQIPEEIACAKDNIDNAIFQYQVSFHRGTKHDDHSQ